MFIEFVELRVLIIALRLGFSKSPHGCISEKWLIKNIYALIEFPFFKLYFHAALIAVNNEQ